MEEEDSTSTVDVSKGAGSKKKGFISPASSFVDFSTLENEVYTEEGRLEASSYDPHSARVIKKPITGFETVVHLLKGCIGAGILAMPRAFHNAGFIPGIIGTILIGALCVYSLTTLIRMQYIQCQRLKVPFLTYPLSMKVALKNGPRCMRPLAVIAPAMVDFFLVAFQLGTCTAYAIFMAESVKGVVEPSLVDGVDLKIYLLILFVPVLLINFIRNLKRLTPVSLTANILIIISFTLCFYYIFFVGPWKDETCNTVSSVTTWPLFIGTALFAIESVGVIIALEHNMQKPQHFLGYKGLFPWSMVVVVVLYTFVGFMGYMKYGADVKGTIVASLPQDQWLSQSIQGIYAICIYGTYPLQMYVALEIIWGNCIWAFVKDSNSQCCVEYLMRTITVIFTFVLALIIPYIDIVISLVGAFCLSCLGIAFPFFIELCTLYPDQLGWLTLLKDLVFIIFGLFILFLGTYVSLYTLITQNES